MKIVVRGGCVDELSVDEMELDVWRFRLLETTFLKLANAAFRDAVFFFRKRSRIWTSGLCYGKCDSEWLDDENDGELQEIQVLDIFEWSHLVFIVGGSNPFDLITNAVKWTTSYVR
ncbi:uncharacterized protein LOC141665041 isoform X4 [Apium graveolens]|uniref:uncharacterized protein LOC141665041 isoform X4 n=2 Tax=Apium graveolens TaxID=4045 RepID=UPI003D78E1C2